MTPWYVVLDAWLRNHKTLIRDLVLGLALILVGNYAYNKWLNHQIEADKVKAAQTQQVIDQQKAKDVAQSALETQREAATTAVIQQYQTLVTNLTVQNQVLAKSIAQRNSDLSVQVAKDADLDTAGVASRLSTIENLPLASVGVSGNLLTLTDSAAHQILQDLETVPVLKENIKDLNQTVVNKDDQLAGLQDIVNRQQDQINTLKDLVTTKNNEVAAAVENTKAQVKLQSDKDKKSRWGWFKAGVIVGAIAGVLGAHAAGI